MPGGGKRVRGGREIRLTQRENENEGRDVSTIDHRDSECNANHAPSLVSVPPTARSRTYPRRLHFTRRPLRRFSYPSLALPPPTPVPSVTQNRQDIDSDTHATHKHNRASPPLSFHLSLKIPIDSEGETDFFFAKECECFVN